LQSGNEAESEIGAIWTSNFKQFRINATGHQTLRQRHSLLISSLRPPHHPFPRLSSRSSDLIMEAESQSQAPDDSKMVRGFWKLPSELRNAVYEELLVTDCAFRLGYVISLCLLSVLQLMFLIVIMAHTLTSLENRSFRISSARAQRYTSKP
jgi:hypothetical protein